MPPADVTDFGQELIVYTHSKIWTEMRPGEFDYVIKEQWHEKINSHNGHYNTPTTGHFSV